MRVIGSLTSYLNKAGYLRADPMALVSLDLEEHQPDLVQRYLNKDMLDAVLLAIESLPRSSWRDEQRYERARWVFTLFLSTGMRRDEVVRHDQSMFFKRHSEHSGTQWWAKIIGKGRKIRTIPVTDECINALHRYRRSKHIAGEVDEISSKGHPLVMGLYDDKRATSTSIYRLVTEVMRRGADILEKNDAPAAAKLRTASPHWLRHTAITILGDRDVSLRFRKKLAGHESIDTTMRYDHADSFEWHNEINKNLKIW